MAIQLVRKKGELTFGTIISAVLVLVLIIVLILIIAQKIGETKTGLSSCESKQAVCVEQGTCAGKILIGECPEGKVCCFS